MLRWKYNRYNSSCVKLFTFIVVLITVTKAEECNFPIDKVKIEVYLESLCPDSQAFVTNQFQKVFRLIPNIIDVYLYPYGKATREKNSAGEWVYTCQHGPQECNGNMIQNCVIGLCNNNMTAVDYMICTMDINSVQNILQGKIYKECAEKLALNCDEILECKDGPQGIEFVNKAAEKTESLQPPLNYVPWIVINEVYTIPPGTEGKTDLLKLVCDTYKGKQPDACFQTAYV